MFLFSALIQFFNAYGGNQRKDHINFLAPYTGRSTTLRGKIAGTTKKLIQQFYSKSYFFYLLKQMVTDCMWHIHNVHEQSCDGLMSSSSKVQN